MIDDLRSPTVTTLIFPLLIFQHILPSIPSFFAPLLRLYPNRAAWRFKEINDTMQRTCRNVLLEKRAEAGSVGKQSTADAKENGRKGMVKDIVDRLRTSSSLFITIFGRLWMSALYS